MFAHLGQLVYRRRWLVVTLWLAVAAASAVIAPQAPGVLKPGGFASNNTEGARGFKLLQDELGTRPNAVILVARSDTLDADSPAFQDELERLLSGVRTLPFVRDIATYRTTENPRFISRDKRTTYSYVSIEFDPDDYRGTLPQLRAQIPASSVLQVWLTGGLPAYSDIEQVSHDDLQRAEMISFPLAFAALLFVFGGLVAAGAPVLVGGISVTVALAAIALLGRSVDMSIFVLNISTMMGLGIGIDYSLFMVSRFREELEEMPSVEAAVVRTVETAGKAVFFSGVTVFIGLSGLVTFEYMMLRSMGIGGAIVTVVSILASTTLLPAVLGILGPRIDRLSVLPRPRRGSGWWSRLAAVVARRPWPVFLGCMVVLLALGSPFLRVRLGSPDISILPDRVESRQGYEVLRRDFGPGEVSPALIVLKTQQGRIYDRENVGALHDYVQEVRRLPGVVRVDSIVSLDESITRGQYQLLFARPVSEIGSPQLRNALRYLAGERVTVIQVVPTSTPVEAPAQELVHALRRMPPPAGFDRYVGGAAAELMDVVADMYSYFPRALTIIVITTYVALFFLFGSVVLPLKAVLMNTLSILASYGALVVFFQDGFLGAALRFQPEGFVDATVPIIMFSVLFGLSMDYEVFMLSRMQEYYEATGDNSYAVAQGLERTGRIITSAALIIVLVSGAFAFAEIIIIKSMGVGTAVAVLLDATIVRALLVPSTMHILGRWNWWSPPFLRRFAMPARKAGTTDELDHSTPSR